MTSRVPRSIRPMNASSVPVKVDLLAPDGSVALTFSPDDKVVDAALRSPEFVPYPYTNGVGQFNDQMLRAEFARLGDRDDGDDEGGWHTFLNPVQRTARTIKVPFYTATGTNAWYYFTDANGNPVLGAIDYDTFGSLLFPATYPFDSSTPVGAAELAGDITTHDISTFLFNNTVLFTNSNINDCCVIGYHTYDLEPGIPQMEIFRGFTC